MKSSLKKGRNRARHWATIGAVAQDAMCKCGWDKKKNECKLCGGSGTEKHRFHHYEEWNRLKLQLEHEVMLMEHIAQGDGRC